MNLLRRRTRARTTAGLDIDANSARLAVATSSEEGATVTHLQHVDLHPTWFTGAEPNGMREIGKALHEAFRAAGVTPPAVHASAANEPSILRLVTPPPVPAKQLENVLKYEIRKNLPLTDEDAEIRHQIITDQEGETRVLVGAVRRPHLQALMATLASARLRVGSLEPRTLAVLRATITPSTDPDLLVTINATSTSITARTDIPIMNRVSDAGANDLETNPEDASRALTTHAASSFTITLAGLQTASPTLRRMLEHHFNREVHAGVLTNDVTVNTSPTDSAAWVDANDPLASYLGAIGLAMKGQAA